MQMGCRGIPGGALPRRVRLFVSVPNLSFGFGDPGEQRFAPLAELLRVGLHFVKAQPDSVKVIAGHAVKPTACGTAIGDRVAVVRIEALLFLGVTARGTLHGWTFARFSHPHQKTV